MINARAITVLLQNSYPQIYNELSAKADLLRQSTLKIERFDDVVNAYCHITQIDRQQFVSHPQGRKQSARLKKDLYAVLMKIFTPERIELSGRVRCLPLTLKIASMTGNSKNTVTDQIRSAVGYYSIYKDFKEQTDNMAKKVIEFINL